MLIFVASDALLGAILTLCLTWSRWLRPGAELAWWPAILIGAGLYVAVGVGRSLHHWFQSR